MTELEIANRRIEIMRAALQQIADADHPEDGGFECGHSDIAEEALRLALLNGEAND